MNRRIELYIGGSRADLSEQGLVLMNYSVTDLYNPTIVRNSWSQDVDLPGTPTNTRIFGSSFRLDRVAGAGGSGAQFNAARRLPFSIYSDAGEVLVSGYCRLNAVTAGAVPTYKVSLFGQLGDFLYGLAYDTAGNKRTLASLDYGVELDFDITAAAVQSAWARLDGDDTQPEMWDVINFAPCYNGLPDKGFAADKAVADAASLGLAAPVGGYDTQAGQTLISLPQAVDEWAAKDLRSYLQRPVLNCWAMLEAIAADAAGRGWSLDLSDIDTTAKWPYRDMWLTRPLLPGLGTYVQQTGGISATFVPVAAGTLVGQFSLSGVIPSSEVNTTIAFRLAYNVSAGGAATLVPYHSVISGGAAYVDQQVLFVQAVGYDADNNQVAASEVYSFYKSYYDVAPTALASAVGYTPEMGASFAAPAMDVQYDLSGGTYVRARDITLELAGRDLDRIDILVTAARVQISSFGNVIRQVVTPAGSFPFTTMWDLQNNEYTPTLGYASGGAATGTSETTDTLRSGAHITKQMLLSTTATPADYLLAICKTFGLYLLTDEAAKSVSILRRTSFYVNETTDLTRRVDLAAAVPDIQPLTFDAKWYDFRHEAVGGAFEKEYQAAEGVQYGIQRVDTGYDFDASSKDLLNGVVLKSAASVQDRSRYWYAIEDNGQFIPSPFLDPGCKYTLWNVDGESKEQEISVPGASAVFTPYNSNPPGLDRFARPEFRDEKNGAVDGANVLLFFNYTSHFDHFRLTDDTPAMDALNGGPCWILEPDADGLDIPHFARFQWRGQDIERLLHFGYPRQVDIANTPITGPSVYEEAWQSYVRDRLSVDNKVLRCRVDLSGLQVGPELFRRFWWWRGSIWVLNKISNYSLTTFDPAECEFIQVRNKNAYLNNQY